MSNRLTSTGLQIGAFGDSIKNILDLSNSNTGFLVLHESDGKVTTPDLPDHDNQYPNFTNNVTLPSIGVGSSGTYYGFTVSSTVTVNVSLPAAGRYCYTSSTGNHLTPPNNTTIDMRTAPVESGGAQIVSVSIRNQYLIVGYIRID